MRYNLTLNLLTLATALLALPLMADSHADLLKKIPEHPNWYQQLQSPKPLVHANAFKRIDPYPTESYNYADLSINTKPFTTLNLQGNYQIEIIGNSKHSGVEITGNQADVLNMQIVTDNEAHSLNLSQKQPSLKTVTVKITTPVIQVLNDNSNGNLNAENLNGNAMLITNNGKGNIFITGEGNYAKITLNGRGNIEIQKGLADASTVINHGSGNIVMQGNYAVKTLTSTGSGNIRIDGLNSRGLDVNSQGNGSMMLSGFANLKTLKHTGNGNLFFYWVDSDNVTIQASGNGTIGLAGQAQKVNAAITGHVVFDSRYLVTHSLEIKTKGNARAKVTAKQQLTAVAAEQSQIFYYNKPTSLLKYTSDGGVILSFP